ncbi:MAG: hypothetical protein JWM02_2992 [Frankiales bacterium]|nr:hypothetical protein [Frankiales bacterium]
MKRLAFLLPLALVAACTGSNSSGSAASAGVSKADYLKQAEAVCAKAYADRSALKVPTAIPALASYVAQVVTLADSAVTALAAVQPPTTDKAELESKVLNPLRTQVREARTYSGRVAAAAKKNDQVALVKLLSNAPLGSKANLRWMKNYGFVECVKAADTSR